MLRSPLPMMQQRESVATVVLMLLASRHLPRGAFLRETQGYPESCVLPWSRCRDLWWVAGACWRLTAKIAIAPERWCSRACADGRPRGVHVVSGHPMQRVWGGSACVNAGADIFVHTITAWAVFTTVSQVWLVLQMTTHGTYEAICDGHHLNPIAVRALQCKGIWPYRSCTDRMRRRLMDSKLAISLLLLKELLVWWMSLIACWFNPSSIWRREERLWSVVCWRSGSYGFETQLALVELMMLVASGYDVDLLLLQRLQLEETFLGVKERFLQRLSSKSWVMQTKGSLWSSIPITI